VYDDPYHVEVVDPVGQRSRGAPVQFSPTRVTEGHKVLWCEERERPVPRLTGRLSGGVSVGEPVMTAHREPCRPPASWPEYLPPFLLGALTLSPNGSAWVERTGPAAAPRVYDVFDTEGRLRERVELPPGRRLIALGSHGVYTIRRDDADLEYIERFALR